MPIIEEVLAETVEAGLGITILSPMAGARVAEHVQVSGSVSPIRTDTGAPDPKITVTRVTSVWVTFGLGGASVQATMTGALSWQCAGSFPASTPSGQPLTIFVTASADMQNRYQPLGQWEVGGGGHIEHAVVFQQKPPVLTVQVTSPVTTDTLPYLARITGTARNGASTVTSVQYKIDNGAFANVDNPKGDWSEWSKTIPLQYGSFQLTVKATGDPSVPSTEDIKTIAVRKPFEPTEIAQVFTSTTYLRELMDCAQRQIKIGSGTGPTPAVLASRLFQPYDKLTASRVYESSNQPIAQPRIAIEVLRRALASQNQTIPVEPDQRFRVVAYHHLLRELGTSYDELRLARLAEPSERRALAARLGFSLEGSRPDRLDRMTWPTEAVTDALLEEFFGYRSTAIADPLQLPAAAPRLPEWQSAALITLWLEEDARTRDAASGALPILEPDVIAQVHIANRVATNPVFALWTARRKWIDDTVVAIQRDAATQTAPLARFDHIVKTYIVEGLPALDLPALAARDAQGENLIIELDRYQLDLQAFRFLAKSRALLVTGSLLESEWQDVFAIVLQVKKRRLFRQWRVEERQIGLTQDPGVLLAGASEPTVAIPAWRGTLRAYSQWRRSLLARAKQRETMLVSYQKAIAAAEALTLSGLRDALLDLIGQRQTPPQTAADTAERLSRELLIDLRAHADSKTTRVEQAIETLQGLLFSVRAGRLPVGTGGAWTINETSFDPEWVWMGSYRTWLAAIRVFAYPENQLFPNLYVSTGGLLSPTQSFIGKDGLIDTLRKTPKMTPQVARNLARQYVERLRNELGTPAVNLPADFVLTDQQLSAEELRKRQELITRLFSGITDPNAIPQYLREVFWLVPMALAQRLQDDREYLVALDWYQTVYAFELPLDQRKRYPGLTMEAAIPSSYSRTPGWLTEELNPHVVARTSIDQNQKLVGRKNVYTRFTVMAIVRCFLAYADLEFARNVAESVANARTLYETALDLLAVPDLRPETGPTIPFPANPVWESLLLHAQTNLAKIHNGMNIAGVRDVQIQTGEGATFLPSQYRYAFLVERAKNLVGIAQQIESAYLSALQQGDEERYRQLQAKHDIHVAGNSIGLANLKVADAALLTDEAELQKQRAEIQYDHFDGLLDNGVSGWEWAALGAMSVAAAAHTWAAFKDGWKFWAGDGLGHVASAASVTSQMLQTQASFERRKEDWKLQRNLAAKDRELGLHQIRRAKNQQQIATQERTLAVLQLEHAEAVMNFLANKFTNAELFEWMSGVLGGVYAYFLQQATALAQLAEAQLAFERQEPAPGFVRVDYWIDTTAGAGTEATDRRGLTGSARLLQDIYRLDQYAFDTDKRKLHMTQTLSLAQLGAQELQQFRDTGVLTFATPEALFDQEFPGHYLRLVKRVKVSLIALVPPVRGVRASLSASGLSRTVVAGDKFTTVTLSRSPETIAFTSPLNATGMFELEPENGMLLPFEGMGVDTVWRLELPKPANPFDYRTIADVLLTFEYTALNSVDYRQKVIRDLDRSFSGDRAFSIRDQFADAWYELNHPEQVETARQMQVTLPVMRQDFPLHVTDVRIQQVTLFCVRADGYLQEVRVMSLAHTIPGLDTVTAGETVSKGGVISTRRPGGAPWQRLVGRDPVGDWTLQLENSPSLRQAFKDESILDVVLVLTVGGVTPAWP
ncbi:hypothetical protein COMA1_40418 [Candidatus Nitrospira nitrosa]|uniref:Uncharacterized protein n=1 Tax=Candidatus Nitrospira nitrosa TaxID=1742972 RepID=A0A0S4LKK4_9BACT|nr:neuraminidase-like domain-containing protein [Candidatus Nitrospira nitrosa]CUS38115.1 hypothetical protein COMA1_40418 [Candidatus Nitrospira nitrosa]